MKKLILIILSAILLSLTFSGTILAATACKNDADCKTAGEKCINDYCANPLEIILERPGEDLDISDAPKETKAVADLPEVTLESAFKTIIKTILGAAMLLTIAAIVVAAIFYILSRGNEEDTSKAKNIILYLVIGMVIMAAAYGLVAGVVQFDFFKAK